MPAKKELTLEQIEEEIAKQEEVIRAAQEKIDALTNEGLEAARKLAERFGHTLVKKGATTASKPRAGKPVDAEAWLTETLKDGGLTEKELRDQYPGKRLRLAKYLGTVVQEKGGKIVLKG